MKKGVVIVNEKGVPFLKSGQMWMFRNNLVSMKDCEEGDIADVISEDGEYLGTGFVSEKSHITVRILTHDRNVEINDAFFEEKIRDAYAFRKVTNRNNLSDMRLIFGDGDGLPGLTVDRYNGVLVTQIISSGMEKRKSEVYAALLKVLREDGQAIEGIYERNDVKAREKEFLPLYKGFYGEFTCGTEQIIHENGLKIYVDIEDGQKTGYFLDQKRNRLLIREISEGLRVCDCFSHTGGFALNAAKGNAIHVDSVDVSATALAQGKRNAQLNGLTNIDFVQADVFEYLDEIQPDQYDLIILDPPAFTKSRKTVFKAYNGYKQINKKAMEVLKCNHGYLATCSCSRYMETALFEQMLKEASLEAGVELKQVSVTQQNSDHPIVWSMSETSYLKFYIFQVNPL